ncbi:hypothetical protein BBK36DRAFT_1180716 [Trichoderma citrinoviride]|uniref:Uncharacterized protein n=1 Tax=Trichoderma citrinoviride TaxID=58853 RepID=A0A2T4B3J6_9HYPO|nr:hypothetical protein BBK36DRAFT_1180716 [Trichoderma citrinoviride]PTB63884.1 hypothetical protein BBK36DRAFT_1180716 [Trichoderma citrinoviride]
MPTEQLRESSHQAASRQDPKVATAAATAAEAAVETEPTWPASSRILTKYERTACPELVGVDRHHGFFAAMPSIRGLVESRVILSLPVMITGSQGSSVMCDKGNLLQVVQPVTSIIFLVDAYWYL